MSKIKTITVAELEQIKSPELLHPKGKQKKEQFLIPDYQRGYRWEAENEVNALLEDIWDFCQQQEKSPTGNKYSLQPLVVTASSNPDFPDSWEVIDGQQRLTTLWLIQKALGKDVFELHYEKRPNSARFLKELVETGKTDDSNPDFYFMGKAWHYIKDWIDKKKDNVAGFDDLFGPVLRTKTDVIWYDVESSSKKDNIDVFYRLNVGKIPLTDTELVKALLLQKLKGKHQDRELALLQSEINEKINYMQTELGKSFKWNFLAGDTQTDAPLDLILKLAAPKSREKVSSLYRIYEKAITESGDSLQQANAADKLWNDITAKFSLVNSLFCETMEDDDWDIYHYAGYLLTINAKSLQEICTKAMETDKKDFARWLKEVIVSELKKDFRKDEKTQKEPLELGAVSYTTNKSLAEKILLLFNVLECNWSTSPMRQRFPFNKFRTEKWSLEHIRPQEDITLKTVADLKLWLKGVLKSIQPIDVIITQEDEETPKMESLTHYKDELNALLATLENRKEREKIERNEYEATIKEIINLFSSKPDHYLANLALLPGSTNSALSNSPFPEKRDKVMEREKAGDFIPPATKNVFLKTYSPSASQPYFWGKKDQEAYLSRIENSLNRLMEEVRK